MEDLDHLATTIRNLSDNLRVGIRVTCSKHGDIYTELLPLQEVKEILERDYCTPCIRDYEPGRPARVTQQLFTEKMRFPEKEERPQLTQRRKREVKREIKQEIKNRKKQHEAFKKAHQRFVKKELKRLHREYLLYLGEQQERRIRKPLPN